MCSLPGVGDHPDNQQQEVPAVKERMTARPVLTVIVIEVVLAALVILSALAMTNFFPRLPGYSVRGLSQSLVLVLVMLAVLLVLLTAFGWWRLAGFTAPSQWRELRLYWLPVVLLLVPFVGGVRMPPLSAIGLLVVAYAATAVFEEGLWRGVMLGLLRPIGVWRAVLISSLLFGLGHLSNTALRGVSFLIVLQAFGAAIQGIGFAALRLRTNTIWPLIVIHALHDLFLQMSTLPIPLLEAFIETAICIYGIVLLRRLKGRAPVDPLPHERAIRQRADA
jgi:membrane protease YdiL (CAAX protease family)